MATRKPPAFKRPVPESTPWKLSAAELRIMDRLLITKSQKLVALTTELSERTVEAHLASVRKKMRERFTLGAVLRFDRWREAQRRDAQAQLLQQALANSRLPTPAFPTPVAKDLVP